MLKLASRLYRSFKVRWPYLKAFFSLEHSPRGSIFVSSEDIHQEKSASELLKSLFNKYKSDKSLSHDYHIPYGSIYNLLPAGPMFEIGIGSHNPNFPSTMGGGSWVPGGSLRAWRDTKKFTHCYGADIDKDVIFNDHKISIFVVDQLNIDSLQKLNEGLRSHEPHGFSLIIDDGFHDFTANSNSFRVFKSLIKKMVFMWLKTSMA